MTEQPVADAAAELPVHAYRWVLMGGLVLCSWAMLWYGFTIGVLLPDISDDLGLRPAQEGWLSSSFFFGQLLLTLPVTALLSRYPPLRTMGAAYAVTAVLLVGAALAPAYWEQVLIRFVVSVTYVALNPVRTLIISGWFRRSEIPRANSFYNSGFGTVQTIAFWSSGALLGVLGGWRAMMWLFAAFGAAGTLAWVLIARASPPASAPFEAGVGSASGSLGRVLRNRQVWYLCLIALGGALTWATYITFWPSFARDELGLSESAAGLVLGCSAVSIIPGSMMAAWVLGLVRSRRWFLVGATLVQVPLFGLWAVVDNTPVLVVIGLLQGFSWIYFPIMLSVPFDIEGFDARDIALASAMFLVANAVALTFGPSVAGVLAEWVSMRSVLLGVALTPLVSTLGAFLLGNVRHPVAPAPAGIEGPGAVLVTGG